MDARPASAAVRKRDVFVGGAAFFAYFLSPPKESRFIKRSDDYLRRDVLKYRCNFGCSARLNCKSMSARRIMAGVSLSGDKRFSSMTNFSTSEDSSSPKRTLPATRCISDVRADSTA